jgi:hypothetical protein
MDRRRPRPFNTILNYRYLTHRHLWITPVDNSTNHTHGSEEEVATLSELSSPRGLQIHCKQGKDEPLVAPFALRTILSGRKNTERSSRRCAGYMGIDAANAASGLAGVEGVLSPTTWPQVPRKQGQEKRRTASGPLANRRHAFDI